MPYAHLNHAIKVAGRFEGQVYDSVQIGHVLLKPILEMSSQDRRGRR